MTNTNLLKILFVEDLPSDVDLAVLELRKEKLKFEHTTVCTRVDLIKALKEFKPDLIISDYMMPAYNGLQALRDVKKFDESMPFILCTGSTNEETAIECIKAGADDYVIKEHMTRLPFAVKEALEQLRIRMEKRAADLLLKDSEEKLQSIFNATPAGIGLVINRTYVEVNDTFCRMTGYSRNEIIGKSTALMYPTKEEFEITGVEKYEQITRKGIGSVETRLKCKDGRILNIISTSTSIDPEDLSKGVTFTVLDITERKRTEEALLKSEHQLSSIYNTVGDVIFQLEVEADGNYRFISVNHAFCKVTGLSNEMVVGKLVSEVIPEPSLSMVLGKYRLAIKENSIIRWEEVSDYPTGRLTGDVSISPVFDDKGRCTHLIGSVHDITGKKQAEEALFESEERFRTLYNDAPTGLYRTNPKGEILLANRTLVKMLGFQSFDELAAINLNRSGIGTSYQRQKFIDQIEKEGEVKDLEAIWICRDGKEIFVRENAKLIRDPEGKILYYDGTVEDITESKRTQEELVESETKYRQLVTQSPDGIFIVDLTGKFLSGNRAICDSLKCTEEELLSMKIWDIVPEQYQSLHKQRLVAIMKGESNNASVEYEAKGKDGKTHCIEVLSVPYFKGNEIVGFQGIARDITERKLVVKALQESEEKYRGIFENVQDLFYETSIGGTILEISPSIKILSKGQYHRDELIGKSIFDFYSDPNERAVFISKLMEQGTVSDFEITLINRDGSRIPCSVSSKIFLDVQGRPEKIIGSARDITDRNIASDALRLAKENAEASDKLKTSFLNNISHEVRTPLNGILGFAEIMTQSDLSEEEKKDSISMLHESSDRLLNTITNYMDISLITSGNMSVKKRDFIPDQVLTRIFDNYKTICLNRKLELLLSIPGQTDNISINSDPEIFHKIIAHLLSNAIKFTGKGSINFGYRIHKEEIEFFVKDTGIGIGKESVDNIFDLFVKEDHGPMSPTEGSGLGLSIAKEMIEIIGGNIRVESEIGVGSCFFFTIPLLKDNKTVLSSISGMEHKKIISGALILVAEDDEKNFLYLNVILTRETGATILHASNGREAIELFKANPGIVLILMDIKMPEVNGFDATRQIKLLNQDVPIIAITAYAMSGDEERVLAAGCDGYLSKPISKKILLEKMAEFIKI
jgi:PAS domain S-box-containing protein